MATATDSQSFLNKLFDDPSFRQQFMSLKSPDAVLSAAKKAGYTFTPQEMKQTLNNQKGLASFSDSQLDSIASASAVGWVGAAGAGVAGIGAGVAGIGAGVAGISAGASGAVAAGAGAAACV